MNKILFIFSLVFIVSGQEILKPNKNYSYTDTMVVFTQNEFNKLDSLMKDYQFIKKEKELILQKNEIISNENKIQKYQISNLERRDSLNVSKLELSKQREDLINEKVKIYKDLYVDLSKTIDNKNNKNGFFNNTFWFGAGSVVGVATVFICSIILNNINN